MTWKNFKLSSKLSIAFGSFIGFSIIFSFWMITQINVITRNAQEVIDGNKLRAEINQRYIDHLKWSSKLGNYVLDPLKNQLEIEKNFHNCAFGKWYYSNERENVEKLVPELKEIFEKIETPHQKLHETAEKITTILHDNSLDTTKKIIEIQRIYKTETMEQLSAVGILLMEVVTVSKEHIMSDEVMISEANNTKMFAIIISFLGALGAIFFAFIIGIAIIKPIKKSVDLSLKIADGDLTCTIDVDQKDEIGQLAMALCKMTQNLKEIITSISTGAENISLASEQMSSNSQSVSQGANEQAAATEEVSSSMELMNISIHKNTENSQQTEIISQQATLEIKESSDAVNQMVDVIKQISSKISIITDIAFQTNILALNAAVEAARAGEHGRGFAVVAAEVRKLAERSQIAAKEIVSITSSSVEIAEKSGTLLAKVIPNIQNTLKLVQEISASNIEMSSGSNQINNSIKELNYIAQESATIAEEMSTTSEELSNQAQQLTETISFFKIDNNNHKTIKKQNFNNFGGAKKQFTYLTNAKTKSTGINLHLSNTEDKEFENF